MWILSTPWLGPDGQFSHWKRLCVVFDNESLGVIERAFQAAGIEIRVRKQDANEVGK